MRLIQRRVGVLFALFLIGLLGAAVRVVWLGTVKAEALQSAAVTQQRTTIEVPAIRGAITDRKGEELAVSQSAISVAATPYLIKDSNAAAAQLAPLLGQPQGEVLAALNRRDTGFVWLARKLPAATGKKIKALNLAGIEFVDEAKRVYPRKFLASQLLGFVGTDGTGLSGLEQQHESQLHGTDGRRTIVKDPAGEPIQTDDERPSRAGRDLRLTIDDRIQEQTEQVLAEVGAKYRPAKGASAIVMDPRDGELLAVANWPRVDANDPGSAPDWAKQDRAVQTAYEPGSTFKAFTFSAALQDRKITPETTFNLPARLQVADRVIGEAEGEAFGSGTAAHILQVSSNVGTVQIGQRLGNSPREAADRFAQWMPRFGFGQLTGVDLPGEEKGFVLERKKYSGVTMGNVPIGQGISVTPMQMVQAYAAIANGGTLRAPRVVKAVGGRATEMPRGRRVIDERVSAQMRTMLEGVIGTDGTAADAEIGGYQLAGKTGTAEKFDPETGTYSEDKYVASFIGFAPAQNPKLLTLVMVDEPQGDIYGGSVAAPAWRDITAFALNYLRIPPK